MTQSLQNKIEEATEKLDAQGLAILFHNTYEGLAPSFGYETREDTKVFDPESKNGKLMIAVCQDIINTYINPIATLAQEEARKEMVEKVEEQKKRILEMEDVRRGNAIECLNDIITLLTNKK